LLFIVRAFFNDTVTVAVWTGFHVCASWGCYHTSAIYIRWSFADTAVGRMGSHDRRLAMPLQRGEVQGYNFNRMAVEFTMVNQGKVVPCSISTAAMDDLEGRRDVKSNQRIDQFMRLREIIEERASRKFFEEQAQADRPVVLRSNDFSS
jgi:hypothetical protein